MIAEWKRPQDMEPNANLKRRVKMGLHDDPKDVAQEVQR